MSAARLKGSRFVTVAILILSAGVLAGCLGEPDYDRRSIDLVFFEDNVYVNQTFRNVTVNEDRNLNDDTRRKHQQWFCDDSSDTFHQTWTQYADKLGMQSAEFRSINVEAGTQQGCDVKISGTGDNFLHSAVFLSHSLKSDTYRVRRQGDRFEVELKPSDYLELYNVEFTIWLSERYKGRLLRANTDDFTRNVSPSELDFIGNHKNRRNVSTSLRRARWSADKLLRDGIQFVFEGPLRSHRSAPPGVDNRPTYFPAGPDPDQSRSGDP